MNESYKPFYGSLNNSTNLYSDIMSVVKSSKQLSGKCRMLQSEAISSIISGAASHAEYDTSELIDEYESKYIKELFSYIDDKQIKDSVYDSFYESKRCKNLIYVYNDIDDEPRRARVRILTRKLWYELIF